MDDRLRYFTVEERGLAYNLSLVDSSDGGSPHSSPVHILSQLPCRTGSS